MKNCHFYLVTAIGPKGVNMQTLCKYLATHSWRPLTFFALSWACRRRWKHHLGWEKKMLSQKYSDDKYSLSPRQRKNRDRGEKNTFTFIHRAIKEEHLSYLERQTALSNNQRAQIKHIITLQLPEPKLHFHFMSLSLISCNDKSKMTNKNSFT